VRGAAHVAPDGIRQHPVARFHQAHAGRRRERAGHSLGAGGGMEGQARARVGAQGARVVRGEDDVAARAVAVCERPGEQRAPDAARLDARVHHEQGEAPQPLAHQREGGPGQRAVLHRGPRAAGVRRREPADP
jgi:hypothetical protein